MVSTGLIAAGIVGSLITVFSFFFYLYRSRPPSLSYVFSFPSPSSLCLFPGCSFPKCLRPYHVQCTGSLLNSEVKWCRAGQYLGEGPRFSRTGQDHTESCGESVAAEGAQ